MSELSARRKGQSRAARPQANPFAEAYELVNQGKPRLAVRVARRVAQQMKPSWQMHVTLGGILIDAGAHADEVRWIKEGVELIRGCLVSVPPAHQAAAHYNLGTGFLSLGQRQRGASPGTRPALAEAVSHLNASLQYQPNPEVRTNLASVLAAQGRWVEACDEYTEIITAYPTRHEAVAGRGRTLVKIHDWIQPHKHLLYQALLDFRSAEELAAGVPLYAENYRQMIHYLEERLEGASAPEEDASHARPRTPFEGWVWSERLGLNMCPGCERSSPDAFDTATIGGVLAGKGRSPSAIDVLESMNVLHRTYATARWCLAQGVGVAEVAVPDQVAVMRARRGVRHDLRTGLTIAGLRGFYCVFDQVAYALNGYFHLGHPGRHVTFRTVWNPVGKKNKKKQMPEHRSAVHPHLQRLALPPVAALFRLAQSLETGCGMYKILRDMRNKLEHHVVVVTGSDKDSQYYHTISPDGVTAAALRTGRLARAAILCLGSCLWRAEYLRVRCAQRKGHLVTHGPPTQVIRL